MSKPDAWRLISNLMDHREERLAEYDIYIDPYKQTVINKVVEELKVGTNENIVKVLGYLDINSIAVRGLDGVYRGRGIYPIASLMNHSCICNTRNIINHTKLDTRATVSIKRGECITTHYVSPLLAVYNRREKLKERWFFECSCPRCNSSTDLQAFTSGVKCTKCTNYQVPVYPLQFKSKYRCLGCQEEISCDNVNKLVASLEPLVQALNVFQMPGTDTEESLIRTLEEKLHPTHQLVLDIKINLARKLGRTTGLLRCAERSVVKNKINLCIETLGVMKIVYPGLSKYRGLLLYELADSLALIHTWILDKQISSIHGETDPSQILDPVSNSIPGGTDPSQILDPVSNLIPRDTDPSQILDIPWIFGSVVKLLNLDISPTTSPGADWLKMYKYLSLVVIEESLCCLRFERDVSYEGDIYRNLINMKNSLEREN
ncbi:histone-lysine N-methyltransferase ASHR1 [Eurytemora carolleeae]|uniref:histone-lysine N-methyltransferase ASHR1 n=1 Tax=Eurytemora carolleeae TaxID=1294199 RepID=UPI000C764B9C|nr:histone-lysine N-methyltransferase ASHR1 [Eurytemora carolleeae]XP_023332460.1 histone-lysine N-methyltransferase ASHR1 [Eurytemora carolleeae]XP_023332461.1 histone-lysine N-methyltransferase ASHR1 [Eurytemora carolleeae]XP_023332462.1 histone-lysine N-methyltransferase ASHR1 [Eurytemora carolleeae]|eukprot:XP_023332459.1 histone-lysine N-methyltransferase ASHR1-like [Eurytemora affinis]